MWQLSLLGNQLLSAAVAAELVLLVLFLGVPGLARLLGGSWPTAAGWACAVGAAGLLLLADAAHKHRRRRSGRTT